MNTIFEKSSEDLAQIIVNAEKVVSNIGDTELKKIAFDRTLEHLLKIGAEQSSNSKKETLKAETVKEKSNGTSKPGPKAWIQELIDEGFFKTQQTSVTIREALNERGHILDSTAITSPLDRLVTEKKLRRKKTATENGGKEQVHWVNW